MRVIIKPDYDTVAKWAANYVVYRINKFKPTPERPFVLGLPTGSTPMGMYQELINLYQKRKVSFENVVTFNMDEYIGLKPTDHQSYRFFMEENLPDSLRFLLCPYNSRPRNCAPDKRRERPEASCRPDIR